MMTRVTEPGQLARTRDLKYLVQAGVLTGISDGLFASVLSAVFFGSTVIRLWQGVASTVFGATALNGGIPMAVVGVIMHFGVAFAWSAVFLALLRYSSNLRGLLSSRGGAVGVAAVYGPSIWLVMSLLVIPLLVQRPPTFNSRWVIQLVGHFPFVGLPIVFSFRTLVRRS